MPLYEYECDACGHRFEAIRKFSDAPLETCPKCGGHVHKLISAPAFQLKGTGWYATDFAGKGKAPAAGASSDGSKSDSKDATKDGAAKEGSNEGTKESAKEGAKETSKDASSAKSETSTSTSETTSPKTNP